jgi:transporter family protein
MTSFSWVGLGLIAALGGAGVAIFGKIGLEAVDPTLATTARSAVMTVSLLGVCLATGRLQGLVGPSGGIDARAWVFIVLAGLAGAVSWLAYFGALRIGAAAQVASIDRLSLAFVIVFAATFLGERYGWRGWVGIVLVVAGILLVASDSPVSSRVSASSTVSAPPAAGG